MLGNFPCAPFSLTAAGVVTKTTDRDSLRYIPTMGPEGCAS